MNKQGQNKTTDTTGNMFNFTTDTSWKHFFPKLWSVIKTPFFNPNRGNKKNEIDLMEQVKYIVTTSKSGQNIQLCKEYINMHRVIENTKARRRLEKWVRRLIVIYLVIIFLLILASCLKNECFASFTISDGVMITILSTTTVNVLGLAFIVIHGHFPQAPIQNKEEEMTQSELPMNISYSK